MVTGGKTDGFHVTLYNTEDKKVIDDEVYRSDEQITYEAYITGTYKICISADAAVYTDYNHDKESFKVNLKFSNEYIKLDDKDK